MPGGCWEREDSVYEEKLVSAMTLMLLLTSMLMLAYKVQPVKASGTICIRADGSIDPPTAPILRNEDLYTLTGNITSDTDGIVIERDNMTLDGAGYILKGGDDTLTKGIFLCERMNVTIRNMKISCFDYGIYLNETSNSIVSGNDIFCSIFIGSGDIGIFLEHSSYNSVSENSIRSHFSYGIHLINSSYNNIFGNDIATGWYFWGATAIALHSSLNNNISGNQISNNVDGIVLSSSSNNVASKNSITAESLKSGKRYGMYLDRSSNNSMSENTLVNCSMFVQASYQNVVDDNLVNGKPLIYLEGE